MASKHDYLNFYKEELRIRYRLKYPPYFNLCLIKIEGKKYEEVVRESEKVGKYLRQNLNNDIIVLGPSSPSMVKINNIYYMQIILKYKSTKDIMDALKFVKNMYNKTNSINIDIDINPLKI